MSPCCDTAEPSPDLIRRHATASGCPAQTALTSPSRVEPTPGTTCWPTASAVAEAARMLVASSNSQRRQEFRPAATDTSLALTALDLSGAYSTGADLTGAHLIDADLTHTRLTGGDFICADLTGGNLTDTQLAEATRSSCTRWPDSFAPLSPQEGRGGWSDGSSGLLDVSELDVAVSPSCRQAGARPRLTARGRPARCDDCDQPASRWKVRHGPSRAPGLTQSPGDRCLRARVTGPADGQCCAAWRLTPVRPPSRTAWVTGRRGSAGRLDRRRSR